MCRCEVVNLYLCGLQDLKEKAPLRAKFGLKDEWVLPFEVRRPVLAQNCCEHMWTVQCGKPGSM